VKHFLVSFPDPFCGWNVCERRHVRPEPRWLGTLRLNKEIRRRCDRERRRGTFVELHEKLEVYILWREALRFPGRRQRRLLSSWLGLAIWRLSPNLTMSLHPPLLKNKNHLEKSPGMEVKKKRREFQEPERKLKLQMRACISRNSGSYPEEREKRDLGMKGTHHAPLHLPLIYFFYCLKCPLQKMIFGFSLGVLISFQSKMQ